jgi:dihydroneopterin aldolase
MGNCTTIAKGMQFWGTHGLFPEENKYGAKFVVDVEAVSDETGKCQNDDYETGVSYLTLYNAAKKVVTTEQHKMVQRVAQRIADEIFEASDAVEQVTVTVKKPFVPIGGIVEYTGCTITRTGKGANSDGNAVPYTGINPLERTDGYAD